MAANTEHAHRGRTIAYAVLAVAVVAGGVFGATQLASHGEPASSSPYNSSPYNTDAPTDAVTPQKDDVDKPSPLSAKLLPEAQSGQEAIDSLGDSIAVAAKRNGMTVDELTELLLRDQTAHVSTSGFILYIDGVQKRD